MTTYLVFKNFVTFTEYTYTVPCAFLVNNTITQTTPELMLQDFMEFIIGDGFVPNKDMIISNLVDRRGRVIFEGPWKITSLKKYVGFQGYVHHYRIAAVNLRDSDC
jgi:hypothetical protein